jgi:hypothetical protein
MSLVSDVIRILGPVGRLAALLTLTVDGGGARR